MCSLPTPVRASAGPRGSAGCCHLQIDFSIPTLSDCVAAMPKIRTVAQLQEALDAEIVWRIREIATFKLVTKTEEGNRKAFLRAGVALVYAHWEGFIKAASAAYLNFVDSQGHMYRDLKSCFAVFGLKGKLALLGQSQQAKSNIEAFDFVLGELDRKARMTMSSAMIRSPT